MVKTYISSLKTSEDFKALKGATVQRYSSKSLLVYFLFTGKTNATSAVSSDGGAPFALRYAFSISAKHYLATERNRIKRLIKSRLVHWAKDTENFSHFSSGTVDVLFILAGPSRHGIKSWDDFEEQLHIDLNFLIKRITKLVL